jgi:hypothetical protein
VKAPSRMPSRTTKLILDVRLERFKSSAIGLRPQPLLKAARIARLCAGSALPLSRWS